MHSDFTNIFKTIIKLVRSASYNSTLELNKITFNVNFINFVSLNFEKYLALLYLFFTNSK